MNGYRRWQGGLWGPPAWGLIINNSVEHKAVLLFAGAAPPLASLTPRLSLRLSFSLCSASLTCSPVCFHPIYPSLPLPLPQLQPPALHSSNACISSKKAISIMGEISHPHPQPHSSLPSFWGQLRKQQPFTHIPCQPGTALQSNYQLRIQGHTLLAG